jgi:WD40 repeat protein
VTFSPDNRLLASATTEDNTVKLWRAETGKEYRVLRDHDGDVTHIAFRASGKQLVCAGGKVVKAWDIATGREVLGLTIPDLAINSFSFHPQRPWLAVAGMQNPNVELWDLNSGKETRKILAHPGEGGIRRVAFSPDGKRLVSGGFEGTIGFWETDTGKGVRVALDHREGAYGGSFSPDGKRVASLSLDRTVRLWDPETGLLCCTLQGGAAPLHALAFGRGGRIAVACDDGTVKIWEANFTGGPREEVEADD